MKNLLTYLLAILALVACSESGPENGGSGGGQETPTSPANEIWYTSTDGKVVELHSNYLNGDGFGANVLSNVYENGKGVITFDGEITAIADCAFYFHSYKYESTLQSIAIPNTVTQIGEDAFSGCSSLSNITIPDGVTQIGDHAFSGCSSLTSITIPDGVMQIGQETFILCSSLESIVIPDNVTYIEDSTFFLCSSLKHIELPNSIIQIGKYAFHYCESLVNMQLPYNLSSIDIGTFKYCTSLVNVYIPESVTTIGDGAFGYCESLQRITIPSNVTKLGKEVFNSCRKLKEVYVKPITPPSIGTNVFKSNASGRKIYVPEVSADIYKASSGWGVYASDIVGHNF